MHFQTPHVFATVNERVMPAIKILCRYSSRYLQFRSFLFARCYENYLCRYARFYTLITHAYDTLFSSLLFNAVRTRVLPSPFFQTLVYLRDLLRTSRSMFSTDIFFLSIFISFSISSLPTLADSNLFHNSSSFSLFSIPKTRFKLSFTFYTFRLKLLSFLFSSAIFKDKTSE